MTAGQKERALVVEYWREHVHESSIACRWQDASVLCWRCGKKRPLERAHLTPRQDKVVRPWQVILLCRACHELSPCCVDPHALWDWIRATHSSPVNDFIRLFSSISNTYQVEIVPDLIKTIIEKKDQIIAALERHYAEIPIHIGISEATRTWVMYQALVSAGVVSETKPPRIQNGSNLI